MSVYGDSTCAFMYIFLHNVTSMLYAFPYRGYDLYAKYKKYLMYIHIHIQRHVNISCVCVYDICMSAYIYIYVQCHLLHLFFKYNHIPTKQCIETFWRLLRQCSFGTSINVCFLQYLALPLPPLISLSFVTVTRDTDGATMTLDGNLIVSTSGRGRFFSLSLLTGYSYTLSIQAPFGKPGFSTANMTVSYRDNVAPCSEGVTLFFPPTAGGPWAISETSNVSPP